MCGSGQIARFAELASIEGGARAGYALSKLQVVGRVGSGAHRASKSTATSADFGGDSLRFQVVARTTENGSRAAMKRAKLQRINKIPNASTSPSAKPTAIATR
jgi:hypothetical protein